MDAQEWARLSPQQQAQAWQQHNARQGPPPGYQPAQGGAEVAAVPRRPFYRKKRWMIPLVLVALFIVLLSAGGNSGGGSSSSAATTPPAPARAITAREWQLIAKDPDGHKGESVIVYGEVTQFDAATGSSGLRADVDGVDHPLTDGFVVFPTNTVLTGDEGVLANVVQKDVFTAKVTVSGSQSYDTQIGGSTTVPSLQIQSITVTRHAG